MVRRTVLDLSDVGPQTVEDPNKPVGAVWVEKWPAGASMQLRLGQSSMPIDIEEPFAYELYGQDRTAGIFVDVLVAQSGVQVIVYTSSADSARGIE